MGSQLCDRSKGGAGERLVGQDREPNLDLIEPGGARRREMKVDVGMAGEPAVGLGLMGVEVVEDDVNLPLGSELTIFCSLATSPFSILSSKNARSSWLLFNRVSSVNFNSRSARVASSLRSAKAISGSIIQNSAR